MDNALNYTTSTVNLSVVVDTTPPPAVSSLTAPLNNLTTNQMTLNFSWGTVTDSPAGLKNYILEVSTSPNFSGIIISSWVVNNSATLTLNQSSYTWRVNAIDNALNYTTSTAVYFVTVDTTPPPAVATLNAPLNNLTTNQMTLTFGWSPVTDAPAGLANYILQVSTDPAFGVINYSSWVVTNSATLTLNQSSYTWRVNTMDNALNYTTSTVKYFVTVDTTPPPAVNALSTPLINLTTNQMTLNFSWAGVTDSPAGLANYILEVSTAPDFSGVITSSWVVNNSATLTLNQSSYTWRVNTIDNALNYTTSTVKYFVTVDTTPPPAVATLNTPLNNLTTNQMTLTFNWTGVSDAPAGLANYILEVSTDPAFGVINYSSWVVNNTATLTLNQSSYTWRVNTIDNALNYTTSTAVYFVTVATTSPSAVSSLTAPLNNLTTNQMTLNFSWAAVSGTGGGLADYILQVSTDPAFSVINYSSATPLTNATLTLIQSSYTWRVNTMDNALNYTTSTVKWSVVVDTTPPPAVSSLTAPLNNLTTNQMTLNFSWGTVTDSPAGLKNYILEVSTSPNFSGIIISSWVVNNSASLTLNQSSYTWRVNAIDNALNYTTSTAVYFVTVDTTPPPAVSSLTAPLNNLTTNQMSLTFNWTGVSDAPAGIANYILQVSTDPAFGVINYSSWVVTNSATLTLNQSSYTWRVNTIDNALNYTTSTAVYFVTVDTTPPTAVSTLNTPLNSLTTNQMTLNFSWAGVTDSPAGLANYILEVSTAPDFSGVITSSWVVNNSATLTLNQSSYTWRVNTIDNALNYTTSTVKYFVTVDTTPPPAVATLNTPLNNLTTNQMTLTFNWTGVSDAPAGLANYILEVSTDPAFGVINYSSWVVNNTATLTLNQSSYTWRVNTIDNALNYTTSTAVYFVTVATTSPSAVSSLTAPLNNLTTNQMTLNFSWSAVSGTGGGLADYILQISTDPAFSVINYSSATLLTNATLTINQSSYTWRVNTMDNALNYTTSTVKWSVVVDTTPPPAIASLTAPLNNLTTNQMTLNFSWGTVSDSPAGLKNYILEVSTSPNFSGIIISSWVVNNSASLTLNQSSYTWRVNAIDNALNYTTSTAVYFVTVDTTPPPAVATLNAPLNNLTTNQMTLTFGWSPVTDPPAGLANYILEVSTDPAFGVINYSSWVVNNTATLTLNQSSYTWRVNTMDNALNYTTSTVKYFVTVDTTPPTISNQIFPANGTKSNQLSQLFQWQTATDAFIGFQSYTLQLATSTDFGLISFSSTTLLTNATLSNLIQNIYYWRIEATDNVLNNSYSTTTFSITIDTTPPSVPVLSSPLNGTVTTQMNIIFITNPSDDSGVRGNSGISTYNFYISTDPAFSVFTASQSLAGVSFAQTLPSGIYFWRVNAVDGAGNYSGFSSNYSVNIDTFGPLIHDNQPNVTQWQNFGNMLYNVSFEDDLSLLNNVGYSIYSSSTVFNTSTQLVGWTAIAQNINAATYTNNFAINFNALPQNTTCFVAVSATDNLLLSTTYYNAFFVLKDTTNPTINDTQTGDNTWRSVNNGVYSVGFGDSGGSGLQRFDTRVMSGPLGSGTVIEDWTTNSTIIANTTYYNTPWPLNASTWANMPDGKSYVSVRALDNSYSAALGYNISFSTDAFYVLKDATPPIVINNQAGDTTWRNSNYQTYNVSFQDASSGSGISQFEVRASTIVYPQGASSPLCPWTVVATTSTYLYQQPWMLPQSVWNSLMPYVNNYIYVSVADAAGNVTTPNAYEFFVLQDTIPPTITDNISGGDNTWRLTNNGVYDVEFADLGGSNLNKFQLLASTVAYNTPPYVFGWTDSGVNIYNQSSFTSGFQMPNTLFNLLSQGTNYISVQVSDIAGSTTTLNSAFRILKDTITPFGIANAPTYSTSYTFNIPCTINYGGSGLKYLKLYYTTQTQAPYTYNLFTTTTAAPISFTAASEGIYGFQLITYNNCNQTSQQDPPSTNLAPQSTTYVDITPPAINNQQSGDDTWLNAPKSAGYSVYFNDTGSGLNTAQYIIRAGANSNSAVLKNWTNIFQSTNTASYNMNWPIDFSSCQSSFNYVSVSVWDMAGNTNTPSGYSFYVKKDTVAPNISYNEFAAGGDNTWRSVSRSGGYNVDFFDGLSGLSKAEYRVCSSSSDVTAVIADWQTIASGISSSTYATNWQPAFTSLVESTTNFIWVRLTDIAGNASTNYAFYIFKDTTPPFFINNKAAYDPLWYTGSRNYNVQLFDYASAGRFDKLNSLQYLANSQPALSGATLIPWTTAALLIDATSYTSGITISQFNLLNEGTNYISLLGSDLAGNTTTWADAFTIKKDITGPTIYNYQAGDGQWRGINNGLYSVYFQDLLSGVSNFQTVAYSGAGMTGQLLDNWRTVLSTQSAYFNQPWQLQNQTFNALQGGQNYISVKCFDAAGNSSVQNDVFYVLKDTVAPIVNNNQSVDNSWHNAGGTLYNVAFHDDGGSNLSYAQYQIYSAQDQSGTLIMPWTNIATAINTSDYTSPWSINFSSAVSGTNYVSVVAVDNAGNSTVSQDVFYVNVDTTPPAAITNLSITGTSQPEGQINMTWTAPGDDGNGGGAAVNYIVKYATFAITNAGGWAAASLYSSNWAPQNPGTTENRSITGLNILQTYSVAIITVDKAGNLSQLSNTVSPIAPGPDVTPPGVITNLTASPGTVAGQILLTWTAVGNDGYTGTATSYDLRWRNDIIINTSNWDNSTDYIQNPLWTPQSAGNTETELLNGFTIGTTYYFAMRVSDQSLNTSSTSNCGSSVPQVAQATNGEAVWGSGALPYSRAEYWQPPVWGALQSGATAAATIRWVKEASCPVLRNEKMVGVCNLVSGNVGNLYIQKWDGVNQVLGIWKPTWTD